MEHHQELQPSVHQEQSKTFSAQVQAVIDATLRVVKKERDEFHLQGKAGENPHFLDIVTSLNKVRYSPEAKSQDVEQTSIMLDFLESLPDDSPLVLYVNEFFEKGEHMNAKRLELLKSALSDYLEKRKTVH